MINRPYTKALCPLGDGAANATHSNYAKRLAVNPVAQHPARLPAIPLARTDQLFPFAKTTRNGQDERHRHIRRIFGQDARRVGNKDFALSRGVEINMVNTNAKIGNEFEPGRRLGQQIRIDPVRNRRDQYIGIGNSRLQLGARQAAIFAVQARVE